MGYCSYIGQNCEFYYSKIGKYCSISSGVKVVVGKHPTRKWVSTHPAFFSTLKQAGFTYVKSNKFEEGSYTDINSKIMVEIGNDVWIGQDVKILAGVKIEDGVIIATGSIVTKNIPAYTIYAGVPAKKIRDRFNDNEKEFLLDFKWWMKSEYWIKNNANLFESIDRLIDNEIGGKDKK